MALILSFLAVASLGIRGLSAQPAPRGPETRVDTASGDQFPNCPSLAVRPMGAFEIAWDYGGNHPPNVDARSYAASGTPITPQTFVDSQGYYPVVDAVTALGSGYRVLFHLVDDLGEEPDKFFRHRIHASGFPDAQASRPVGADDTLWVWPGTKETLLAGKYNAAQKRLIAQKVAGTGKPAGFEYVLNSRPIVQPNPVIVDLDERRFVAAFTGLSVASGSTPARQVLRARRFSISGPIGPDFDVNTTPPGPGETAPFLNPQFQVAAAPNGGFAVSWALGQTIYLRYFDAAGHPATPEIPAIEDPSVFAPVSMAFDDQGSLALLWLQFLESSDLQIQSFGPDGAPRGSSRPVRSAVSGEFQVPLEGSVSWAGNSWLVTWVASTADGSSRALFVRHFVRR